MIDLFDTLALPFTFPFMREALVIAMLVAVPAALLSCFLVLKGWSLMGDAISHAVLPGVVLSYVAGLPLAVGAFASGMICALATGYLKENSRIKEDTVMGIVFSGMFGLGIVLYTKVETEVHLDHILFGDMLGVDWPDLLAERDHRGGRCGHHRREVAGSAAACLRSAAGPGHGPAGAASPLRLSLPALVDDCGRVDRDRHHSDHCPADHAGRGGVSPDEAVRDDADRVGADRRGGILLSVSISASSSTAPPPRPSFCSWLAPSLQHSFVSMASAFVGVSALRSDRPSCAGSSLTP